MYPCVIKGVACLKALPSSEIIAKASNKSFVVAGLVKKPLNPILAKYWVSFSVMIEVIITSFIGLNFSCNALPKSAPFIPGICISNKAISNILFECSSSYCSQICNASSAFLASVTVAPQWLSWPLSTFLLVSLSSTIRMLSRFMLNVGSTAIDSALASSNKVKLNWLPLPKELFTVISPSINKHSFLVIAKPKPVPPNSRVVEASTCVNLSNSIEVLLSGIPIPVSWMEHDKFNFWLRSIVVDTVMRISPEGVNFIAFETKLVSIWRILPGSPLTKDCSTFVTSRISSIFFSWASKAIELQKSPNILRKSKSINSRVSFPASIFEKSRMSLISISNDSALDFAKWTLFSWSLFKLLLSNKPNIPNTPFMGVLISWLILAKNSLFKWLFCSAIYDAFLSRCRALFCRIEDAKMSLISVKIDKFSWKSLIGGIELNINTPNAVFAVLVPKIGTTWWNLASLISCVNTRCNSLFLIQCLAISCNWFCSLLVSTFLLYHLKFSLLLSEGSSASNINTPENRVSFKKSSVTIESKALIDRFSIDDCSANISAILNLMLISLCCCSFCNSMRFLSVTSLMIAV